MKKIYIKAIEMADSTVLKDKLIAIVTKINNSDYAERFIDVLFDVDVKEEELSKKVQYYDEVRTLKSFDFLNDRINYDYIRTTKRYFSNEEDATEYAKSGNYDYNTSKSNICDGYSYEGIYIRTSESYCNLYEWLNSKAVTE